MNSEFQLVNYIKNNEIYKYMIKDLDIIDVKYEYKYKCNNLINKFVDIYINTKQCDILIECKKTLKCHDIGQILTYKTLHAINNKKPIILGMICLNVTNTELKLIKQCLKVNKLNISLFQINIIKHSLHMLNNKKLNYIPTYEKTAINIIYSILICLRIIGALCLIATIFYLFDKKYTECFLFLTLFLPTIPSFTGKIFEQN